MAEMEGLASGTGCSSSGFDSLGFDLRRLGLLRLFVLLVLVVLFLCLGLFGLFGHRLLGRERYFNLRSLVVKLLVLGLELGQPGLDGLKTLARLVGSFEVGLLVVGLAGAIGRHVGLACFD
ncbi:MAG: hypothetical protein U5Q03_15000 [Bacteroidota bacterium]|nr:hypothetical protein [Bacteroidota bacterium]